MLEAPAWREDPWRHRNRIRENIHAVIRGIAAEAKSRPIPTIDMVKQWHRDIYAGVGVPVPCYVGTFRGDPACPELVNYGVKVGDLSGFLPEDVDHGVRQFEERMQTGTAILDPLIPVGMPPQTAEELRGVINLAAAAHGEWILVHPFVNGNGRTARLWGNWTALRYGLPPFIRLKPHPSGSLYAGAAAASMQEDRDHDHSPTAVLFMDWLTEHLRKTTSR